MIKQAILLLSVSLILCACSKENSTVPTNSLEQMTSPVATEAVSESVSESETQPTVIDQRLQVRFGDKNSYGTFSGTLKDGKPEGQGYFVSEDGWKYEGEFSNGLIHGSGTLTEGETITFNGDFVESHIENGVISFGNDLTIRIKDGLYDKPSYVTCCLKIIEFGLTEAYNNEDASDFQLDTISDKRAYEFIEQNIDEFLNASGTETFIEANSQQVTISDFRKNMPKYMRAAWNWSDATITDIDTQPFDLLNTGSDLYICSITMADPTGMIYCAYVIGDELDDLIDTINIGDSPVINGIPFLAYSLTDNNGSQQEFICILADKIITEKETIAPTVDNSNSQGLEQAEPFNDLSDKASNETNWSDEDYVISQTFANVRYADNTDRVYTQLPAGTVIGPVRTFTEMEDFVEFSLDGINVIVHKDNIEPVK